PRSRRGVSRNHPRAAGAISRQLSPSILRFALREFLPARVGKNFQQPPTKAAPRTFSRARSGCERPQGLRREARLPRVATPTAPILSQCLKRPRARSGEEPAAGVLA